MAQIPTLIYLVGAPGSGKSTLMRKLTEPFQRVTYGTPEMPAAVAHDALWYVFDDAEPSDHILIGAEIGKRREQFGGTDALPSSVIEKAIPWVQTHPYDMLLGEGDRLGNMRFLTAAHNAGYRVTLALLEHDDTIGWRTERDTVLGRTQAPAWVQGRFTASRNLANQLQGSAINVLRGHPDEVCPQLSRLMSSVALP